MSLEPPWAAAALSEAVADGRYIKQSAEGAPGGVGTLDGTSRQPIGQSPLPVLNASRSQPRWDLKLDFEAVGDGQEVADGAMTAGQPGLACLTSTPFTAAHVGKTILVIGAGAAGANLLTSISGYTDAGHVTLAANAGTTVAGAGVAWGTDDTGAIQAAINAMAGRGFALTEVPDGIYIMSGAPGGPQSAQLAFPYSLAPRSYGFVGYQSPYGTPGFQGAGQLQLDNDGAIFLSLLTNPTPGGDSSVFAGVANAGNPTNSVIVMDGVTIRTPPQNAIAALNNYWTIGEALGLRHGVRIDTMGNDGGAPQPLAPGAGIYSYGHFAPKVGNRNKVRVGELIIDGYTYGLSPADCFAAKFVSISHCLQAMQIGQGYFAARIEYLLSYSCPRHLVSAATANPCPLALGHWAIEDDAYIAWVNLISHLDTAVTANAKLYGRADSLTHIVSGTGRVATAPTQAAGTGTISFPIGTQFPA